MIVFGAPYYCLELYTAYTDQRPSDLILALAGGAAVAPSSIDPWIFLLFWVNWNEPEKIDSSRRLATLSFQHREIRPRRSNRSQTLGTSSVSDTQPHHNLLPNTSHSTPCIMHRNSSSVQLDSR